ncbi:hypothetical protein [Leptolyngbya iicbica]|uniref:Uncharacterized protein n=2 Tax=Cyanophyceae TaxID=3028117 RepID=A0A4Q7E4N7_9CYAN|nr:hypothetical protein [Leptolyngbya sp. LK]RZM76684.1 hypothetical protein DYY88_18715 [Leptolyngbya sp. LK]
MTGKQFGWLGILFLLGCSGPSVEPSAPQPPTSEAANEMTADATTAESTPSANVSSEASMASAATSLEPDQYCYFGDNDLITGAVRLTVDESGQVDGDSVVSIHNEEAGYYSSYAQNFAGELLGDRVSLTVSTWIEYDLQAVDETWQVTAETLTMSSGDSFFATECDDPAVTQYFIGPGGVDSATLLADLPPAQRVEFAPGTSQTTLENSLVRGDRDVYLLGAQGGQTIVLDIYSLEDNAVFDLVSPSGMIMVQEATSEVLLLPQTGDYQLIVGGTRGNTTYTLEVAIE